MNITLNNMTDLYFFFIKLKTNYRSNRTRSTLRWLTSRHCCSHYIPHHTMLAIYFFLFISFLGSEFEIYVIQFGDRNLVLWSGFQAYSLAYDHQVRHLNTQQDGVAPLISTRKKFGEKKN